MSHNPGYTATRNISGWRAECRHNVGRCERDGVDVKQFVLIDWQSDPGRDQARVRRDAGYRKK
jgi:hypothetical protein